MKTIRFILISLVLGIVSGAISHTALAQKGVRLVGFLGGDDSSTLSIDISYAEG